MAQEEKQLLLQDLCARLPYNIIMNGNLTNNIGRNNIDFVLEPALLAAAIACGCKPYLRHMSSMTEEEKRMLWEELDKDMDILETNIDTPIISVYNGRCYRGNPIYHEIDFLNRNMFDWRGLIPMRLALEASEGMYNTKEVYIA